MNENEIIESMVLEFKLDYKEAKAIYELAKYAFELSSRKVKRRKAKK